MNTKESLYKNLKLFWMLITIIKNKKKRNNLKLIKKKIFKTKMKYKKKDQEICQGQVQKDNKKRRKHQIFQIDFHPLEQELSKLLIYPQ